MQSKLGILIFPFVLACVGLVYGFAEGQGVSIVQSCGITVMVSGGQFSPQAWGFEIISRGQECAAPGGCPPDYSFVMRDTLAGHIMEVSLFRFRNLEAKTFHFDPAKNLKDFSGPLLDERATARQLLQGEVVVQRATPGVRTEGQRWKVSFDLSFASGIRIQGSGEVPVTQVAAP